MGEYYGHVGKAIESNAKHDMIITKSIWMQLLHNCNYYQTIKWVEHQNKVIKHLDV